MIDFPLSVCKLIALNPLATVHLEGDNPHFRAVSKSVCGPVREPALTLPAMGDEIKAQAQI